MHIEPGVVNEAKMVLSYATAAGATGLTIKYASQTLRQSKSAAFVLRLMIATFSLVWPLRSNSNDWEFPGTFS